MSDAPLCRGNGEGTSDAPLLSVTDLTVAFDTDRGPIEAVSGVSFDVAPGEVVGVVGESGAGKSVTARTVMGLLESPPGHVTGGEVLFEGRNVLEMSDRERRSVLGSEMAMVFQEPSAALNPAYSVGEQIAETVRAHRDVSRGEAWERAVAMLDDVGIPDPEERANEYPHQFSGGMAQRAWLAVALSCDPDLLVADEPTTALDVTTQAQILELLRELQDEYGLAVLFVTHDLTLAFDFCDRIDVMYAGEIVERGSARALFADPKHPYVLGLVNSMPSRNERKQPLPTMEGAMPAPGTEPSGCAFRDRCPFAEPVCAAEDPTLRPVGSDSDVRHVESDSEVREVGSEPNPREIGSDSDVREAGSDSDAREVGSEPDHEAACFLYGRIERDQEEITWPS